MNLKDKNKKFAFILLVILFGSIFPTLIYLRVSHPFSKNINEPINWEAREWKVVKDSRSSVISNLFLGVPHSLIFDKPSNSMAHVLRTWNTASYNQYQFEVDFYGKALNSHGSGPELRLNWSSNYAYIQAKTFTKGQWGVNNIVGQIQGAFSTGKWYTLAIQVEISSTTSSTITLQYKLSTEKSWQIIDVVTLPAELRNPTVQLGAISSSINKNQVTNDFYVYSNPRFNGVSTSFYDEFQSSKINPKWMNIKNQMDYQIIKRTDQSFNYSSEDKFLHSYLNPSGGSVYLEKKISIPVVEGNSIGVDYSYDFKSGMGSQYLIGLDANSEIIWMVGIQDEWTTYNAKPFILANDYSSTQKFTGSFANQSGGSGYISVKILNNGESKFTISFQGKIISKQYNTKDWRFGNIHLLVTSQKGFSTNSSFGSWDNYREYSDPVPNLSPIINYKNSLIDRTLYSQLPIGGSFVQEIDYKFFNYNLPFSFSQDRKNFIYEAGANFSSLQSGTFEIQYTIDNRSFIRNNLITNFLDAQPVVFSYFWNPKSSTQVLSAVIEATTKSGEVYFSQGQLITQLNDSNISSYTLPFYSVSARLQLPTNLKSIKLKASISDSSGKAVSGVMDLFSLKLGTMKSYSDKALGNQVSQITIEGISYLSGWQVEFTLSSVNYAQAFIKNNLNDFGLNKGSKPYFNDGGGVAKLNTKVSLEPINYTRVPSSEKIRSYAAGFVRNLTLGSIYSLFNKKAQYYNFGHDKLPTNLRVENSKDMAEISLDNSNQNAYDWAIKLAEKYGYPGERTFFTPNGCFDHVNNFALIKAECSSNNGEFNYLAPSFTTTHKFYSSSRYEWIVNPLRFDSNLIFPLSISNEVTFGKATHYYGSGYPNFEHNSYWYSIQPGPSHYQNFLINYIDKL